MILSTASKEKKEGRPKILLIKNVKFWERVNTSFVYTSSEYFVEKYFKRKKRAKTFPPATSSFNKSWELGEI